MISELRSGKISLRYLKYFENIPFFNFWGVGVEDEEDVDEEEEEEEEEEASAAFKQLSSFRIAAWYFKVKQISRPWLSSSPAGTSSNKSATASGTSFQLLMIDSSVRLLYIESPIAIMRRSFCRTSVS